MVLDGRGSADPDEAGAAGIVSYEWFEDLGSPSERILGEGEMLETFLQVGTHGSRCVWWIATVRPEPTTVIHVADTRAPAMTLSVSPATLRPADHRLVDVTVSLHTTDECGQGVTFALESVISNEPDDAPGGGDGHTVADIRGALIGTPDTTSRCAERSAGRSAGRR